MTSPTIPNFKSFGLVDQKLYQQKEMRKYKPSLKNQKTLSRNKKQEINKILCTEEISRRRRRAKEKKNIKA